MGKYYIKPSDPEWYDYRVYYDDSQAVEDHIYARGGDGWEVNKDLYKDIKNSLESFYDETVNDHDDLIANARYFFKKENGTSLTMRDIKKLAEIAYEFAECGKKDEEDELIAEALSVVYGEEFVVGGDKGYGQGDYVDMIYPKKKEKIAEYAAHVWLATGTEFMLTTDAHDNIPDFSEADHFSDFCIDDVAWDDDRLKQWAADIIGCKKDEVVILDENGEIKK